MLERFRSEILAPLPGADHDVDRALRRVDAEGVVAAIDDRAQVAVLKFIRGDDVGACLLELLGRNGDVHPIDAAAVVESPDVVAEAENRRALILGVVAANALEEAGTVVDDVSEGVD